MMASPRPLMRVLMVDRGRMVEHGEDYPFDGKSAYDIPARDKMPAALAKSDYFALNGWVSPATQPFFINDRLNPYDYDAPNKFNWVRPSAFRVPGKICLIFPTVNSCRLFR
jgi:hypothetical protein